MDELKKYLQQNRESLDKDEPGEFTWPAIITGQEPAKKSRVIKLTFRLAAAAVLLAAIAAAWWMNMEKQPGNMVAAENIFYANLGITDLTIQPEVPQTDTVATNIKAMEKPVKKTRPRDKRYMLMNSFSENYEQLVGYQLSSIRATPVYAENPSYFTDFKIRLNQMDSDEKNIRKNILHNGITNNLLEQLINIYQQKLDVLKSLQSEINKMNTRVLQNANAGDSLNKYYLNL